jgi:hypothetical protein
VPEASQPRPAIDTGNVVHALTNSLLAGLDRMLADPNLAFHKKGRWGTTMGGFDDRNHPTRQAFNARVHQRFPTQAHWQSLIESYPAVGPDQTRMRIIGWDLSGEETIGVPLLSSVGGRFPKSGDRLWASIA